jgi:CDP-glucose 4,6-dehydratase
MFEVCGLESRIRHYHGDVRDLASLRKAFLDFQPEIVFHLAAQALVRSAYQDPVHTFSTNLMGTLHVLECLRTVPGTRAAVIITSDKCYRNVEWTWGYRECDLLGGEDPYSGSKGGAELIAYSYFHSFFAQPGMARVATARAGNVIGGGDWARDRIVPDCVRAWSQGDPVVIRSPGATRPWQHVLEPLSGYLLLASELWSGNAVPNLSSYNFGPDASVNQPVLELIARFSRHWDRAGCTVDSAGQANRPEATLLKLCCDKALADLRWGATLSFDETVRLTSLWYKEYYSGSGTDMQAFSRDQIRVYCDQARAKGLPWSQP